MATPYYAQRKLPAEVGVAKMDWPSFHAGRESAAIAEFGRAFGAVGELAEKRMNAITQTEYTSGKADWETAHNVFLEDLRDDPDFENYTNKYEAYSKKIQKDILGTKSPIAKKILSEMFKSKTPSVKKSISNIAWERKSGAMAAETLTAVRKFELAGNSAAAEAALLEAVAAGTMDAKYAASRALQIKSNIEWNDGYQLAEHDPEGLLAILDKGVFENLDKQAIEQLRTKAEATIAGIAREEAAALKLKQDQTASQFLADLWENKLTDPQVITNAVREGWISDANAKYLRDAILNPEPPETDLKAYTETKKAINDLGRGAKTVQQTLDVVYKNIDRLDPATGKSLVGEIFGEHDKHDATMQKEGRDLMEELIRDKDPISGMLSDDARQIIGTAEALVDLDASIKEAASFGKPLRGTELLIEAIKIGRRIKQRINKEEAAETGVEAKVIPDFGHKKKLPEVSGEKDVLLGFGKGKFIPDDVRLYQEPPGYTGKEWNKLSDKEKEDLWLKAEKGGVSGPPVPKVKNKHYIRVVNSWKDIPGPMQDKILALVGAGVSYEEIVGADDLKPYLKAK